MVGLSADEQVRWNYDRIRSNTTDDLFFHHRRRHPRASHLIYPTFDIIINDVFSKQALKETLKSIIYQDTLEFLYLTVQYGSETEKQIIDDVVLGEIKSSGYPLRIFTTPIGRRCLGVYANNLMYMAGDFVLPLRAGDVLMPNTLSLVHHAMKSQPSVNVLTFDILIQSDSQFRAVSLQHLGSRIHLFGRIAPGNLLVARGNFVRQFLGYQTCPGLISLLMRVKAVHVPAPFVIVSCKSLADALSLETAVQRLAQIGFDDTDVWDIISAKQRPAVSVILLVHNQDLENISKTMIWLKNQPFTDVEILLVGYELDRSFWGRLIKRLVRLNLKAQTIKTGSACDEKCLVSMGVASSRGHFILQMQPGQKLPNPNAFEQMSLALILKPSRNQSTLEGQGATLHRREYMIHQLSDSMPFLHRCLFNQDESQIGKLLITNFSFPRTSDFEQVLKPQSLNVSQMLINFDKGAHGHVLVILDDYNKSTMNRIHQLLRDGMILTVITLEENDGQAAWPRDLDLHQSFPLCARDRDCQDEYLAYLLMTRGIEHIYTEGAGSMELVKKWKTRCPYISVDTLGSAQLPNKKKDHLAIGLCYLEYLLIKDATPI